MELEFNATLCSPATKQISITIIRSPHFPSKKNGNFTLLSSSKKVLSLIKPPANFVN